MKSYFANYFHVVNHSTYHRGQLASLRVALGVQVPVSDYMTYKR